MHRIIFVIFAGFIFLLSAALFFAAGFAFSNFLLPEAPLAIETALNQQLRLLDQVFWGFLAMPISALFAYPLAGLLAENLEKKQQWRLGNYPNILLSMIALPLIPLLVLLGLRFV